MNKQEFELMVRARDFINMSTPEKLAVVPDVIRYLKNSAPYNNDGQLMKLLGEIERETVVALKNQKLDELADFFVMEASRLASTDKHYVQYGVNFDSGAFGKRNVRINKDIDAIADEERFNANIASRVAYLKAPERDIVRVTKIRGDGNCYFRAITTGFLQKAFCSEPATREVSLKHFARLIREQLINPNEMSSVYYVKSEIDDPRPLDIKQHEQGEQLLRLAAKLDSMATGADPQVRSMQALHDLFEDKDFNDAIIKAARALLTHNVMSSLNESRNGSLSLEDSINFSDEYGSIQYYAQNILLKMGRCMEGPATQFDLLARALGTRANVWFFPREAKNSVENYVGVHQAVDGGFNFWPNNPLNLMLRPGHYDLLETQADYEQRRQVEFAQGQAPQKVAAASLEQNEKATILVKPQGMSGVAFNAWQQIKQMPEHSFSDDSLSMARFLLEDTMSSERDIKINGKSLNDLISKMAAAVESQKLAPKQAVEVVHAKATQPVLEGQALKLFNLLSTKSVPIVELQKNKEKIENWLRQHTTAEQRALKQDGGTSINDLINETHKCLKPILDELNNTASVQKSLSSHQKMSVALGDAEPSLALLGEEALKLREFLLDTKKYYQDTAEHQHHFRASFVELNAAVSERLQAISATERALRIDGHNSINDLIAQIGFMPDASHKKAVAAVPKESKPVLSGHALKVWEILMRKEADEIASIKDKIEYRLITQTTPAERAIEHDGVSINQLINETHQCLKSKLDELNQAAEDNDSCIPNGNHKWF